MEYYYWLIAAIVLVIVEICTAGFGALCFAIGAAFSALVSGLGGTLVGVALFLYICRIKHVLLWNITIGSSPQSYW